MATAIGERRFGASVVSYNGGVCAAITRVCPQQMIVGLHREVLNDVQAALARHAVVVLGMARNPFVARARKALDDSGERQAWVRA